MAKKIPVKEPVKITLPVVTGDMVAKDWTNFATEKFPLRSSALKYFVECPMKYIHTLGDEFVPNDRMNTGSAVHYLIERTELTKSEAVKRDYEKCWKDFPLASREDTASYYVNGYWRRRDEIEAKYGKVVGTEKQFILTTKPAAFDPTQKPIIIGCTVDQLRYDPSTQTVNVIDFKVSMQPIAGSIRTYALQLATYMLAIDQHKATLGLGDVKKLKVAAWVCNPIQMAKPRALYAYPAKFTLRRAEELMNTVRMHVAAVRSGTPARVAGYGCTYCPKKSPDRC